MKPILYYLWVKGRATRKEAWLVLLAFFALCLLIQAILVFILGISDPPLEYIVIPMLLFVLLPSYVRRLHDLGRSGWIILLGFVPIIGQFAVTVGLVFIYFVDGQPFENAYGKDPKGRNTVVVQE